MSKNRTLVLCVDRDDDIGYKASIDGPVVGREACLRAANALGLVDPEDSDINAIFEAVRLYDELYERGEDVAVAVITGDHMHLLDGDRKIAKELDTIIRSTGADYCILVTDGAEDEYVLPIIQSNVVVSSVKRVVVKQMPNLEGTYYILKKLLDDPKVARAVLVPLGLALLLYAAAFLMNYPEGATIVVGGVIGIYLLFKGFGIDEVFHHSLSALQASLHAGRFTFVSYIVTILMVIVGIIMGLNTLLEYYQTSGLLFHALAFLYGGILWFTAAGLVASVGKIIDILLNEREGIRRVVALPFFVLALGAVTYGASIYTLAISEIPEFPVAADTGVQYIILLTVGGLFCAFFGVYLQSLLGRWTAEGHPVMAEEDA
ncbi:MAG: DUF373 family protein [Methanomicrobiaceae archaeon]|uniref:DUF373 family protein n=1 Tax=hydrocarbon metagenome TaxID=938273 RepID=A0A0W8FKB1_9ZZZZ|nr:DUF373 family protein [Methanomicrobiaceae archaeon]MDD5418449.1 DUF373 family protein [Methanomicrobiaceae archaeon]